jgi:hypothetical protein
MELGNTPGAVETQIRKLLKERKLRERAVAFEARRWRMAMHGEPPGLLAGSTSEK